MIKRVNVAHTNCIANFKANCVTSHTFYILCNIATYDALFITFRIFLLDLLGKE